MSTNFYWKKMLKLNISARLLMLSILLISTISSQAFAVEWRQDLPQAKLLGSGDLRWFGLHIYNAKLWSAASNFDAKSPFALELTYQRAISRERFVDTSIDEIKRLQGSSVSPELLQRWRKYMETAFTDVKHGEQLIGVNLPKIGCKFYSRDKLLAEINDPQFADAFFAIWFDPRSKDSNLRQQLIGAQP
ncbi:chalcone isomerase family protein [Undibacterium sp. Ren11W]|uniref:chalcone isomerase family protein n=1 Tax=Undibacterium sp. Ren11W TaxID=3413045 RepID=UPI003BF4A325